MLEILFKFLILKLLVVLLSPLMLLFGTVIAFKALIFGVKHKLHELDEALEATNIVRR